MRLLVLLCLTAMLQATELRVLTWNVLGDPGRAGRGLALRNAILAQAADVICLQEVAPWFLAELAADKRFAAYRRTVIGERIQAPGGCFLMSRWPIHAKVLVLPSRQDRVGLVVEVKHPQVPLTLAVVHLDSPLGEVWQQVRSLQLAELGRGLAGAEHACIIGDANFGDGEPEQAAVPVGFQDVWPMLNPKNPGLTWDRERNHLADEGSFPSEGSRRLDRCWVRSSRWVPVEAGLVGTEVWADNLHPSDHFGLIVRLIAPDG